MKLFRRLKNLFENRSEPIEAPRLVLDMLRPSGMFTECSFDEAEDIASKAGLKIESAWTNLRAIARNLGHSEPQWTVVEIPTGTHVASFSDWKSLVSFIKAAEPGHPWGFITKSQGFEQLVEAGAAGFHKNALSLLKMLVDRQSKRNANPWKWSFISYVRLVGQLKDIESKQAA